MSEEMKQEEMNEAAEAAASAPEQKEEKKGKKCKKANTVTITAEEAEKLEQMAKDLESLKPAGQHPYPVFQLFLGKAQAHEGAAGPGQAGEAAPVHKGVV